MQNLQRLPKLVTSHLAAAGLAGSMLIGGPALAQAQTVSCTSGCDVGEIPGQITAKYNTSNKTLTVSGVGTLSHDKWRRVLTSFYPEDQQFDPGDGTGFKIVFAGAESGSKISLPEDSSLLFSYGIDIRSIWYTLYLPDNLDTSQVKNMAGMFVKADWDHTNFSNWDTSNVTDMSAMFTRRSGKTPEVANWDVSNVTNMAYMFYRSGTNPDVSKWDVSKVTITDYMFAENPTADPDISNWDYRSLKTVDSMFCEANATKWKSTSLGKQLKECGESTVSYDGTGKDKGMMSPAVIGTVTVIALLLLALGAAGQMGLLPLVMPRP